MQIKSITKHCTHTEDSEPFSSNYEMKTKIEIEKFVLKLQDL